MLNKVLLVSVGTLLLLALLGCNGSAGSNTSANTATSATVPVSDITVSPLATAMAVDDTTQFTATTKDAGTPAFQWTSSNPAVATIDSNGLATGTGAGTTEITATMAGKSSVPIPLTLCDFRHL